MGLYTVTGRSSLAGGQPEDVSQVLANLDLIAAILNGSIDNANLAAGILASKLAGYPADATKVLKGDGTWGAVGGAYLGTQNVSAANTDLAAPTGAVNFWVISTSGGTLRSIGAGVSAGARITLKNGTTNGFVTLKHQLAGGTGAQLFILGVGDRYLGPGQSIELQYDGTNWVEVDRPAIETIFDVVVGRGNVGDPASPVAVIDSNTILGGNIPQTYNHLKLVIQARCDLVATFDTFYIRLNNDATANYDYERLYAQAAVANASENIGDTNGVLLGFVAGASAVAGGNSEFEVRIPNYTRTDFLKSVASAFTTNSTNATNGMITGTTGGKWRSTAAVTRVQLRAPSNLITGSRVSLFGLSS